MNEKNAGSRVVLTSLPLTVLFTAAVLFFGLRYAEYEPLVFLCAGLIAVISAAITGKLLKTHRQPRWILFVWILSAVILFGYMLLSWMMQYPANSKRISMNNTAKQILTAANTALEDMQKADQPFPESPYIIRISNTPEPDSLADRISHYFSDISKIKSYGLILRQTDDGVREAEAYYSFDTVLTPDTLTETPKEVQLSQLGRLYRQTPLVFCWKAGNSVLESENTKQNSRQTECPTEDAK